MMRAPVAFAPSNAANDVAVAVLDDAQAFSHPPLPRPRESRAYRLGRAREVAAIAAAARARCRRRRAGRVSARRGYRLRRRRRRAASRGIASEGFGTSGATWMLALVAGSCAAQNAFAPRTRAPRLRVRHRSRTRDDCRDGSVKDTKEATAQGTRGLAGHAGRIIICGGDAAR